MSPERVLVWKREGERNTREMALDVNRCFTFFGLSFLCPVGSFMNNFSCSSYYVLCIPTQQLHHESLKSNLHSDLLTPNPTTSSAGSSLWVLPFPPPLPAAGITGNGNPGVLDLAFGLLLPCPRAPGGRWGRRSGQGSSCSWSSCTGLEAA